MRVLVLGGTRFIGRATVEELVKRGHEVTVVHRGVSEPADFPEVTHLHADRANLGSIKDEIDRVGAEGAIDTLAMTRAGASAAIQVLPKDIPVVVLSSCDVYRAYTGVMKKTALDPLPLYEDSPLREERYPYRGGQGPDWINDYDKIDVEEEYAPIGASILRLPMVYGEHDGQRREEFILRRVRAGRKRIPIGPGTWLSSRGYVKDIARGIASALENFSAKGQTLNLAERATLSTRSWAEQILEAAKFEAELVEVGDEEVPPDMGITRSFHQHLLIDSSKARNLLDWKDTDSFDCLFASVAWHLENPPELSDSALDFSADEAALASV